MKRTHARIAISLFAVLSLITVAKFYPSSSEFEAQTYLVDLSEGKLSAFEDQKIERLIDFDSGDVESEVLTESNSQIITTTKILIDRLKLALEICSLSKCKIEKQFYALSPPYADSAKILRHEVEANFSVQERRNVLRNIVVILGLGNFDENVPCGSFVDDLTYVSDNFGGLAIPSDAIPLCSQMLRESLIDGT